MTPRALLILFLFLSSILDAANYFVAPNGNNKNPGTFEEPFQSINYAVKKLKPGDVLNIRQGVYQEFVTLKQSGTKYNPIRIQAYGLEYVEISGVERLKQKWTLHDKAKNIYVADFKPAQLDKEIAENNFQLFVDKASLLNARWPNCRYDELLTRKGWQRVGKNSSYGQIDAPFLKNSEMEIEGADIYLNIIHQFFTWNRKVTRFDPAKGIIEYPANINLGSMFFQGWWAEKGWKDDYFYLQGKYDFLDHPGEFHFDAKQGKLYVIPPAGKRLDESLVEVKKRLRGLYGQDLAHVQVRGIHFFGCAINLFNCSHFELAESTFRYPVNAQELKESIYQENGVPNQYKPVQNSISGNHLVVRDVYAAYASQNLFGVSGNHNLVENSIFHDASHAGSLYYKCLSFGSNQGGGTIRRCTVFNAGNVGIHFGGAGTLVELNHVFNTGMVSHDVSAIYTSGERARKCRITRNWVHDNPAHIGGNAIRGDDLTRELTIDHNVVWNIAHNGIIAKGDHNSVFNNTVFSVRNLSMLMPDRAEPRKDHQIRAGKVFLDRQNAHSLYFNNMVVKETSDKKDPVQPIKAGQMGESYFLDGELPLQDVARYNFHPRESHREALRGQSLPRNAVVPVELDASSEQPYIGAYGFNGSDWKPGAVHGIKYQIQRENEQFVFRFKYTLPLLADDGLSILINGTEVNSGQIQRKSSFRSLAFYIDEKLLKPGTNSIVLRSESFGAIEDTYFLQKLGSIHSERFPEAELFRNAQPIELLYHASH